MIVMGSLDDRGQWPTPYRLGFDRRVACSLHNSVASLEVSELVRGARKALQVAAFTPRHSRLPTVIEYRNSRPISSCRLERELINKLPSTDFKTSHIR